MKKSIGIITAAFIYICILSAAQACPTGEGEYIVVFQPGISWEKAAAEVSSWGSSYHLAAITTDGEQKRLEKLLSGLRGEFWIGGYQDSMKKWHWVTGEPWGYTHWAPGEPDGLYGRRSEQYLAISRINNELGWNLPGMGRRYVHWGNGNYEWFHDARFMTRGRQHDFSWEWNDEGKFRRISGFIAEREIQTQDQPAAVPLPPAIWVFASGVGVLAGVRQVWKRRNRIPTGMADPQPK